MHLRNVEIFCDTVVHRSFSKAAGARGISQPAVSQAIQQLEERLGLTLIDRSKRPLELTPAGHVYYDGCRKLLDDFREVEERVQELNGRVIGRIRIAAIYSIGLLQMSEYVQEFESRHPEVDLRVEYLHPDEVYSRVRRDEADFGLVSFPRDGGDVASIPWQHQEMGLVVPPRHPLAGQALRKLADLQGARFVGFTPDLTIRRETDRLLKKHRVSVELVHEFDNIENIKRAVEIGAGAAILPLATVRREVDSGLLVAVHFQDVQFVRPLGIIHKRHKHLSMAAERFVQLLCEELGSESPATSGGRKPTAATA
ncbi:MAG: LysR family transcriptional regulator [Planctomycetaceae bacterium]